MPSPGVLFSTLRQSDAGDPVLVQATRDNVTATFDPETHRYYLDGRRVVGITEALALSGIKPPPDPSTRTHAANVEYACQRGTAVHKMCELDDLGKCDSYDFDANLLPYLDAWRSFKRDYGFAPDFTERFLVHEVFCFGGIPDSAGPCDKTGGYTVVERKVRELDDADELQVAGQSILLKDVAGKPVAHGLLVRLKEDGKYQVKKCADRRSRGIFLAAVTVANYRIGG